MADDMLLNFYRWVSNPSTALHDRGLRRTVASLMAKMFVQLIAEMKRLGASIVSANAHSIIICTGKRNVTAAVG